MQRLFSKAAPQTPCPDDPFNCRMIQPSPAKRDISDDRTLLPLPNNGID
jgi:hypothetical protein